jgi:hypothetical protein
MQNSSEFQYIAIDQLFESKTNPRKTFDQKKLEELADYVPGHKICLLWRSPFCGIGREETNGGWRSTFRREHNG